MSRTVLYEDFSGGIDRRNGTIGHDGKRFYDLVNYTVIAGRKLKRRMPLEDVQTGAYDSLSQGSVTLNGEQIIVAKAGEPPVNTPTGATVYYFDNPEYCTTWTLNWIGILNDTVCAVITHTYPGGDITSRVMLHVWDEQRPTWVDDPAAPTDIANIPLQPYGEAEKLPVFTPYTPVATLHASRWVVSLPSGDTALSAVNRPRVWNTRTPEEILVDGRYWSWIMPSTTNVAGFFVPIDYEDFTLDQRYAAYVVERFDEATKAWILLNETTSAPDTDGRFQLSAQVNPYTGDPGTLLLIRLEDNTGDLLRLRTFAKPPVTVQVGAAAVPPNTLTGGILSAEGVFTTFDTESLSFGSDGSYFIMADALLATAPRAYDGTLNPLNGYERYKTRIRAVVPVTSGAFSLDHTGTVTVEPGSRVVTGAGTLFLTETAPGRYIEVNGESIKVTAVRDNLTLEVEAPFSTYGTGLIALKDLRYRYAHEVGESGNEWFADREAEATFKLAGAADAAILGTSRYESAGGMVLAVAPGQDRVFIQFATVIQMWQVTESLDTLRLLARHDIDGVTGRGILIEGYTVLPTTSGPRFYTPTGNGKDYVDSTPIGDALRGFTLPTFTHAVWWQSQRVAVFASNAGEFYVLSFIPSEKIAAWSRFTFEANLTDIRSLDVDGQYLWIRNGNDLHRLNAASTSFRDDSDGATAFASTAKWLLNDLGSPLTNKRMLRCEVAQQGKSTISVGLAHDWDSDGVIAGPTIEGYTHGRASIQLVGLAPAIGLSVTSTDETGHELDGIGFQFIQLTKR